MNIVVVGATGNVGTALVRALERSPRIKSVVGVARRLPGRPVDNAKVRYCSSDISVDPLDMVAGADVVVHLAWLIQPSHDEATMHATNVAGTRRLIDSLVAHDVPALVYASSVGTYAAGPKDRRSDESWPATGIPSSTYSRHKATVEALLDKAERAHPALRVVRIRTSLVFQRAAAAEVHRLFLGHLPWHLPKLLRFVPSNTALSFQATHADDVADAYIRAITGDVRGAFNVAAEPVLTPRTIARAVDGRTAPIPLRLLRLLVSASYRLRIQPSEAGWLDMAMQTPIMDTTRARSELGWGETVSATDALVELLAGIGEGAGTDTPPLAPR